MDYTKSNTKIEIIYRNKKIAKAIRKAIIPDNIGLSDGENIVVQTNNNVLKIEIFSKSLGRLIATLDDLLSCVQAAEKTLEEINFF